MQRGKVAELCATLRRLKAARCSDHEDKKQVSECWDNPVDFILFFYFVEPLTLNQLCFIENRRWDIAEDPPLQEPRADSHWNADCITPLGETLPCGSPHALTSDTFSVVLSVVKISRHGDSRKECPLVKPLIFLKCCLGLFVREYNDNSLCLQRVFLSLWCLSLTRLFTYTQVPTLLNSCKPTRSLLSNVVNTCATMFIFFSLSPGTLPAKEIKPLYRVELKSFPLWRKYYNPYH